MCENKKEMTMEEKSSLELKEEEINRELLLDQLENVAGGSMRDTVRTKTHDITDSIKDRV